VFTPAPDTLWCFDEANAAAVTGCDMPIPVLVSPPEPSGARAGVVVGSALWVLRGGASAAGSGGGAILPVAVGGTVVVGGGMGSGAVNAAELRGVASFVTPVFALPVEPVTAFFVGAGSESRGAILVSSIGVSFNPVNVE